LSACQQLSVRASPFTSCLVHCLQVQSDLMLANTSHELTLPHTAALLHTLLPRAPHLRSLHLDCCTVDASVATQLAACIASCK
jgi:hypothetical protein